MCTGSPSTLAAMSVESLFRLPNTGETSAQGKRRVCGVCVCTPTFFRSEDICITHIFADTRQTGSFRTYAISFHCESAASFSHRNDENHEARRWEVKDRTGA